MAPRDSQPANMEPSNEISDSTLLEKLAKYGDSLTYLAVNIKRFADYEGKCLAIDDFIQCVRSNPTDPGGLLTKWQGMKLHPTETCRKIGTGLTEQKCFIGVDGVNAFVADVEKVKIEMAQETVKAGMKTSGLLLVSQVVRLGYIWLEIKDAKNLVATSRQELNMIHEKVKQLVTDVDELQLMIDGNESNEAVSLKIVCLQGDFMTTKDKITSLRAKINGKIETLDKKQEELAVNGVLNFFHGVMSLVQAASTANIVSKSLVVGQAVVSGAFFSLSALSIHYYHVTYEVLDQLRAKLDEIKDFG